ncbi:MAG: extracellular solute-binding protein [Christensenellales bacterium]|jgi:putative aldouronate transport system substrate-binding protein
MFRRTILPLLLAFIMIAMMACSPQEPTSSATATPGSGGGQSATAAPAATQAAQPTEEPADKYADEITIEAFYRISKSRLPNRPSLVDEWLKENLNLVIDWIDVQDAVASDSLNMMFASDEYPEFLWDIVNRDYINERGLEGFMIPVNQYFDRMPNLRGQFNDEDWATLLAMESAADGNMYFFSGPNYRSASMCWIYRQTAFDEWNLTFPNTVDDLYELLKTIKQNDPSSIPMPNRSTGGIIDGLKMAYFVKSDDEYVHAITGEFIPYGRVTDDYREVLKWANTFYEEKLVDPEFITMNDTLWTERYAQGLTYIEYSYVEREVWAEATMSATVPGVEWSSSFRNISQFPEQGFLYGKENPVGLNGYGFTDKMSDEAIDRVLDWIEYICSDEGAVFMTMGNEGVTWEYNSEGIPQFMDHMYHFSRNPEGKNEWMYGMYMGALVQPDPYLIETDKISNRVLSDAFNSDPDAKYSPQYPSGLTVEERTRLNELQVTIKDVSDEYRIKFIMGDLDINNDADWAKYLADMEKVGLEEASQLRIAAYDRVK